MLESLGGEAESGGARGRHGAVRQTAHFVSLNRKCEQIANWRNAVRKCFKSHTFL